MECRAAFPQRRGSLALPILSICLTPLLLVSGARSQPVVPSVLATPSGLDLSQSYTAAAAGLRRTLASRAGDSINPRDFGAYGNGTAHPVGAAIGITSLASLAAWSGPVAGLHPYSFVTSPYYGLTFSIATATAQSAAGTALQFPIITDNSTYSAAASTSFNYAQQADVVLPGMTVSGSCIVPGTAVASVVSATPFVLASFAQSAAGTTVPMPYTAGMVVGEAVSFANPIQAGTVAQNIGQQGPNTLQLNNASGSASLVPTSPLPAGFQLNIGGTIYTLASAQTTVPGYSYVTLTSTANIANNASVTAASLLPTNTTITAVGPSSITLSAPTTGALVAGYPLAFAGGGSVVLSTPTSSACASGTSLTFALSNTQAQAVDMDWLGLEAAAIQAQATGAGTVHVPVGHWMLNHMLVMPNSASQYVRLVGDGKLSTVFQAMQDTGYGSCLIGEGNRSQSSGNVSAEYTDFAMQGPNYGNTTGITPAAMNGLCQGGHSTAKHLDIRFFFAGINSTLDHQVIEDVWSQNSWAGWEYGGNQYNIGNQKTVNDYFTGNSFASVLVDWGVVLDVWHAEQVLLGFGPYGIVHGAAPYGMTPPRGLMTNGHLEVVQCEACGDAFLYGQNFTLGDQADKVQSTHFEASSQSLASSGFTMPGSTVNDVVHLTNFSYNVLTMSDFAGPNPGLVKQAIFNVSGSMTSNRFADDVSSGTLIQESNVPPITSGFPQANLFYNDGDGEFSIAEAPISANQVVQVGTLLPYDQGSLPASVGGSIRGVALQSAKSGATFAVKETGFQGSVNIAPGTSINHGALVCQSNGTPSAGTSCGTNSTSWVIGVMTNYGGTNGTTGSAVTQSQVRLTLSPVHP